MYNTKKYVFAIVLNYIKYFSNYQRRYSHSYISDDMEPEQNILEKNNGVLLIRELPDTVKLKETEAETYSAIMIIMMLPLGLIFARILTDHTFRYCT